MFAVHLTVWATRRKGDAASRLGLEDYFIRGYGSARAAVAEDVDLIR
jgi:hypothetical protein